MSILGKVAEYAVAGALDMSSKTIEKISNKIDQKSEQQKNKLFEKPSGMNVLVINQKRYTWVDTFYVFDENQEVKYSIKGEITSLKRHLYARNTIGEEVGSVKETLVALRSPLSVESNPVDFVIEIGGKKLGKVKSRSSLTKHKYEVCFNNWTIEGNIISWKYKILDGTKVIAEISPKVLFEGDTYVITFDNPDNELLILLLVLALDIAHAPSKREDLKRTVHRKSHGWL